MPNTNNISLEQREKAYALLELAWHFSGKPHSKPTIGRYNALAKHIGEEIECTIVGKSIKNFAEKLENCSPEGFQRNTSKETLAGYVLVKANIITEVDVVPDPTESGINHPEHKYWVMFEEHFESLKLKLPERVPSPSSQNEILSEETHFLKPILSYYEGTTWFLFSRARTGGIYRLLLFIEKEKIGTLNKVYVKNGSTQVEDYIGWVGADVGQEYLIFNLVTRESKKKHLHVKVKTGSGTLPQLAMGQSNFISSFSPQIMSDAIVLMRAPKDVDIETAAKCLMPNTPEYFELPLCLRCYFHEMYKCRLIAPRPYLINLHQLEEWLKAQRAQKEPSKSDKILLKYCGDYAVFYETPESIIEERHIRISLDPNVEEIFAAAATDYRNEFMKAEVSRHEKTITLFQVEPTGGETRTYYLSFKVPLETTGTQEPFHFEGLVSGCWQGLNGGFSRALVIKKDIPDFESKSRKLVRDFFLTAFQILEQQ